MVIVANCPSLNEVDFDRIKYPAWGMNHIPILYPKMKWRPVRWWWGDHPQNEEQMIKLFAYIADYTYESWIRRDVGEILTGEYRPFGDQWPFFEELPDYVKVWQYCYDHNGAMYDSTMWPDELHICDPEPPYFTKLCKPDSGIIAMLTQAMLEEWNPIYLIGADLGFGPDPSKIHFHPDYTVYNASPTEESATALENTITMGHGLVRAYAKKHGIEVYNAGIGGALEVYPRVQIEDIYD